MQRLQYRIVPAGLILLPLLIQLVFATLLAVNVPRQDSWQMVRLLPLPFDLNLLLTIWLRIGETRAVISQLLLYSFAKLTAWDLSKEVYLNWSAASLIMLGWWLIFRRVWRASLWAFVPIAWLVCNLGQAETILWGWVIHNYLVVLGCIWSIYFLTGRTKWSLLAAILTAIMASLSYSNGFVMWLIGLFYLVTARASKWWMLIWSIVAIVLAAVYYADYTQPIINPSPFLALVQPLTSIAFVFISIGAPLGGGHNDLAMAMGLGIVGLILVWIFLNIRDRRMSGRFTEAERVGVCLMLIGLLSTATLTAGRAGSGAALADYSRYITMTTPTLAGLYLLYLTRTFFENSELGGLRLRLTLFGALIGVFVVGLGAGTLSGIKWGTEYHDSGLLAKYVFQTFESQTDDALMRLHPRASYVRDRAPVFKSINVSAFREPIPDVLLLTLRDQRQNAGQVLLAKHIEQTVVCPVHTLRDLSVRFSVAARPFEQYEITLSDGEKVLGKRTQGVRNLVEGSWEVLSLPRPATNCLGRSLTVQLELNNSTFEDSNVGVWVYPRYYDGNLIEPLDQSSNNVVALQMNSRELGLIADRLGLFQQFLIK